MASVNHDNLIWPLDQRYTDYLSDESGITGCADTISFPRSVEEIRVILAQTCGQGIPVTIQSGRTGVSGGCVPVRGHLLNVSGMDRIGRIRSKKGRVHVPVQPGVFLDAVESFLDRNGLFWPVDPTEKNACIGGIAANNAAGPLSWGYGALKEHVASVSVMDLNGEIHALRAPDTVPFFGSEGMLGIITELELIVRPVPNEIWAVVFFFDTSKAALEFACNCMTMDCSLPAGAPVSLDYMNNGCLDATSRFMKIYPAKAQAGRIPEHSRFAVSLDLHGPQFSQLEPLLEKIMNYALDRGTDPETSWAFSGSTEVKRLTAFRHLAMESALFFGRPEFNPDAGGSRPGMVLDVETDPEQMITVLSEMEATLLCERLTGAIFGSCGTGRFRVALEYGNPEQYNRGRQWIDRWVMQPAKDWQIMPKYGIGKLRVGRSVSKAVQEQKQPILMKKRKTDPGNLWNPGNMENERIR